MDYVIVKETKDLRKKDTKCHVFSYVTEDEYNSDYAINEDFRYDYEHYEKGTKTNIGWNKTIKGLYGAILTIIAIMVAPIIIIIISPHIKINPSINLANKEAVPAVAQTTASNSSGQTAAKIKELKDLLDSGLISQEEFDAKRQELLKNM